MRTQGLLAGERLTEVTARLATALGCPARLLPMTDDTVRTELKVDGRWLEFQEYFVHQHHAVDVTAVRHAGVEGASPTPEVLAAIAGAELIVFAPSNPFVSIGTILAVPGIAEAIAAAPAPVVAVSPIVGGAALRGPADRMLQTIGGGEASAAGVVAHYRGRHPGLVDAFVIDERDAAQADAIRAGGPETLELLDTVMTSARHPRGAGRRHPRALPAGLTGPRITPARTPPAAYHSPVPTPPRDARRAAPPPPPPVSTAFAPLYAIVPLRTLAGGKARLGGALDAEEREELVLGMLRRTLGVLADWAPVARVLVVSPDAALLAGLRGRDVTTIRQYGEGLNEGLQLARDAAVKAGAKAVLIVPADLPHLDTAGLDGLLEAADAALAASGGGPLVVIAPPTRARARTRCCSPRPRSSSPASARRPSRRTCGPRRTWARPCRSSRTPPSASTWTPRRTSSCSPPPSCPRSCASARPPHDGRRHLHARRPPAPIACSRSRCRPAGGPPRRRPGRPHRGRVARAHRRRSRTSHRSPATCWS